MEGRGCHEPEISVDTAGAFINRDFSATGGDPKDTPCRYGAIVPLQSMTMKGEGDDSCTEGAVVENPAPTDRFTVPDIDDPDDLPCAWGPFRPAFCQKFRDPKVVLVLLCCISTVQGMVVNGFISVVISSIEKRFVLSSTETGFVASAYDIASVLMLIPISYFGGIGRKPRWLGCGILLVGIGSFLFSLPHFTTELYQYETSDDNNLCDLVPGHENVSDTCPIYGPHKETTKSLSSYKYLLIIAQLLHGAGATPLYTLGVTYMDENLKAKLSPLYMGIFYSMAIIGPAAGYVLGGELLSIYCDFDKVDTSNLGITPDSPAWVGAWWIGFLLSGTLALLISIPIFGFPKSLPGTAKLRALRVSEAYCGSDQATASPGFGMNAQQIPASMKVLFTNPTFMFLNMAGACEGILISGFTVFTPKFVESQFSISAGWAAQLVGMATIPAGGGGTLLGGYLVKRLNLNIPGILKMCLITSSTALVLTLGFLVHCDNVSFAGVNVKFSMLNQTIVEPAMRNLSATCNSHCHCVPQQFDPICGSNQVMYYSPCYAGCQNISIVNGKKIFYNCECIYDLADGFQTASDGKCSSGCNFLALFIPLFASVIFVTLATSMPALTATLRCVPDKQRSFALGIQWILVRCLGTIPAPILFGNLIDKTCQLWQKPCEENNQKVCSFYDNKTMGSYLLALVIMGKSLSVTFFFLSLYLYKAPPAYVSSIQAAPGETISTSSTMHMLKQEKASIDSHLSNSSKSVKSGAH